MSKTLKNARFANCHTPSMERQKLVIIRNLLESESGKVLMAFLQDYVTQTACSLQREASEVKGMCELIQQLKDVPKKVENKRE